MARQNLGAPPSRPHDYVDIEWVTSTYPSLSGYVTSGSSFTVTLPSSPIPNTMYLLEVHATANINVTVPNTVLLTVGTTTTLNLLSGKNGFFGFRYSSTANSWFLLSMTAQV